MIEVDYCSEEFIIKSVQKEDIPSIQKWFNYNQMSNENYEDMIDIKGFYESYFASYLSKDEYFLKIYRKKEKSFIGIVKGRIDDKNLNIYFLMMDKNERNVGNGSKLIRELIYVFNRKYSLDFISTGIVFNRDECKRFWVKNGFKENRIIENYFKYEEGDCSGVILDCSVKCL